MDTPWWQAEAAPSEAPAAPIEKRTPWRSDEPVPQHRDRVGAVAPRPARALVPPRPPAVHSANAITRLAPLVFVCVFVVTIGVYLAWPR